MIKTYGPYLQNQTQRYIVIHYDTETKTRRTQVYARYVWEQEHGPIPNGLQVDHIDGDPLNNDISNLQLLTPKDNSNKWRAENEEKVKMAAEKSRAFMLSDKNPNKRLTTAQRRAIHNDKRHYSVVAKEYNIHRTYVWRIRRHG